MALGWVAQGAEGCAQCLMQSQTKAANGSKLCGYTITCAHNSPPRLFLTKTTVEINNFSHVDSSWSETDY